MDQHLIIKILSIYFNFKQNSKVVLRAKIGLIAKNMLAIPNRSSEEDAEDLK